MRTGNEANKKTFKYDEYSHGLDYFIFAIDTKELVDPFFTKRIEDLDTDNSNFGAIQFEDEVLSIHKYNAPTGTAYQFSIQYNTVSVPIFTITEFSDVQSRFTNFQWGVIHIYGMYYRLIELEYLSERFINTITKIFYNSPVSRFDYRFDFGNTKKIVSIPEPEKVFPNIRKNKKRRLYFAGDRLQSWDLGTSKNKTILIRCYNKLDELDQNLKKTYLYGDFSKFKTYTRLEYEFGKKFCNGYTGKDIPELIEKAFKVSGINESSFTGNMYKAVHKLDLSDMLSRMRYIKIYKSMTKTLVSSGIDPISLIKDVCKN